MKRDEKIDPPGVGFADSSLVKNHPRKADFSSELAGLRDELGARFDISDFSASEGSRPEIVEEKTEITFSGTDVDDSRRLGLLINFFEYRKKKAGKMINLL
jgi:hypothetical protein